MNEQGHHQGQQLARHRHQRDTRSLAACPQPRIERAQHRIVPAGGEGGHVDRPPHTRIARLAHVSCPAHRGARFVRRGVEPREATACRGVNIARSGRVSVSTTAAVSIAHPGNRLQARHLARQRHRRRRSLFDRRIEGRDLLGQHPREAASGCCASAGTVGSRARRAADCAPGCASPPNHRAAQQRLQGVDLRRRRPPAGRLLATGIIDQQRGIEGVGLRAAQAGAGMSRTLAGGTTLTFPPGGMEGRRQPLPVRSGRLHDDQRRGGRAALCSQGGQQRLPAVRVVGQRRGGRGGGIAVGNGDGKGARGDVDADQGQGSRTLHGSLRQRSNGRRAPSWAWRLVHRRCVRESRQRPLAAPALSCDDLAGLDAYQALARAACPLFYATR